MLSLCFIHVQLTTCLNLYYFQALMMKDVILSHTIPDTLLEPGSRSTHRVGLIATTHSLILCIA